MSIFHVQISSEIMREAGNRPFQRSRFVLRMLFILLAFFQVSSLAYNLNLNEDHRALGARKVLQAPIAHQGFSWGSNEYGVLGTGNKNDTFTAPVPLPMDRNRVGNWIWMSVGVVSACGVSAANTGYCWGSNEYFALGNGNESLLASPSPVRVALPIGLKVKEVSTGAEIACALDVNNEAWCWGSNSHGQLGLNKTNEYRTTVPRKVLQTDVKRWAWLGVGYFTTCGVDKDTLAGYCWGQCNAGQCGLGYKSAFVKTPTKIASTKRWKFIVPGYEHSCGITTDLVAFCFGNNAQGQLGDNTYNNTSRPTKVFTAGGTLKFSFVGAGWQHTVALTDQGSLYGWGNNEWGQLGIGPSKQGSWPRPQRAKTDFKYSSADAGFWNSCAVTTTGQGMCYGYGAFSVIGDGTSSVNAFTPTPVKSGRKWNFISVGVFSASARSSRS